MREIFSLGWCGLILVMTAADARTSAAETEAPISLEWRLVENRPDSQFVAELRMRNGGNEPFPAHWSLYFNSDRKLRPESETSPLLLEHVDGDLYRLRPAKGLSPLGPNTELTVRWTGAPWAINVSDAPSGLYLVVTDEAGVEQSPVSIPVRIGEFPHAKLISRGSGDRLSVVTPASRFAENEHLELLPPEQVPKVVPTPLRMKPLPGQVEVTASTTIVYEPALAFEAHFLAQCLEKLVGAPIPTSEDTPGSRNNIHLRLGAPAIGDATNSADEAYRLTIRPKDGMEIVGSTPAGVFYGIQTLRALAPIAAYGQPAKELAFDGLEIEDTPRFAYRGLMLDVARNFQTKETVKKLLDLMAFYKLNRFHWHLTDDEGWRIEIKALPELTDVGSRRGHAADESTCLVPSLGSGPFPDASISAGTGHYSQHEFIEILRFAHERHIDVVPEIDVPGHSRAAIKAMAARARRLTQQRSEQATNEFLLTDPDDASVYESVQMWRGNVMDVGRESTYRFLNVVVGELVDMYRRAGVPLEMIHLGGDEVPEGAWLKSPACQKIAAESDLGLKRNQQLQLHFLDRVCDLVAKHGVRPACWEDCLLFGPKGGPLKAETRTSIARARPFVYVWNNVWGWGQEDAAYRLANAGYDVVLSNATNLYFDLAQEKEREEPGYYWAGFVGIKEPFEFNPFDVFQIVDHDSMGQPISAEQFRDRVRLNDTGRQHILGIQGQLWGENLRDPKRLEYMAFPRTIALAERAWAAAPAWTAIDDAKSRTEQLERDWNRFANCLGQRELPRLDFLMGGVQYRIPPPGAVVRDGRVFANTAYPGLEVRYTTDGTDPSANSAALQQPLESDQNVRLRAFSSSGFGSRTITVAQPSPQ